jgi:hypothetical protein
MKLSDSIGILDQFSKIDLASMDSVSLMNRMDSKYIVSGHRLPEILERVKPHYRLLEVEGLTCQPYETRYYDTQAYYFFRQHVTGSPIRYKVRFREYKASGISFLEVKKRTGKWRTSKCRIGNKPLDDGKLDPEGYSFLKPFMKFRTGELTPVLLNGFTRLTLVESGFRERATIDFDLSFSDQSGNTIRFPFITIVELKRDGHSRNSPLAETMKALAVNPAGFSKYCIGISSLYDVPGKNVLKGKLCQIKKIEDEYNRYWCA